MRERADSLRVGIVGLGTISSAIIEQIAATEGCTLAAGGDVRPEARTTFERAHGLPAFEGARAMCESGTVDVVWVATPNHQHCAVALDAIRCGAHVVCEKPLAATLAECDALVAASAGRSVRVVQGHSRVFDAPVQAIRQVIQEGALGRVLQVDSWMFNDWLQRPRLAEELDIEKGGGVVMRQGPHMVDIARFIVGTRVESVHATSGGASAGCAADGNFTALLDFEGGAAAALSFNGYGHFDIAELTWGIDAAGRRSGRRELRRRRPRRDGPMTANEKFGEAMAMAPARLRRPGAVGLPFFGLTIVSCERGVVRQSPRGLFVYGENGFAIRPVAPARAGAPELNELRSALDDGRDVFPDARWGRDTVEICLGIIASARGRETISLAQGGPLPLPNQVDYER